LQSRPLLTIIMIMAKIAKIQDENPEY